jgi:hypothetical protein
MSANTEFTLPLQLNVQSYGSQEKKKEQQRDSKQDLPKHRQPPFSGGIAVF